MQDSSRLVRIDLESISHSCVKPQELKSSSSTRPASRLGRPLPWHLHINILMRPLFVAKLQVQIRLQASSRQSDPAHHSTYLEISWSRSDC